MFDKENILCSITFTFTSDRPDATPQVLGLQQLCPWNQAARGASARHMCHAEVLKSEFECGESGAIEVLVRRGTLASFPPDKMHTFCHTIV